MPEALDIYRREKLNNRLLFNCDEFWITQNYVKLLDSFFNAMWIEFIKNNMSNPDDPNSQSALAKTQYAHGAVTDLDKLNDDDKIEPQEIYDRFMAMRLKSAAGEVSGEFVGAKGEFRISVCDYTNNETRFENSLKFLPIWCEAFVVTSLVWTFIPLFRPEARRELAERIELRMKERKADFQTYQKQKKKAATGSNSGVTTAKGAKSRTGSRTKGGSNKSSANTSAEGITTAKEKTFGMMVTNAVKSQITKDGF